MYEELVKALRDPCPHENCVLCQQAAEAIEELSKPRWIPVAERLPENGGYYLVYLRPFTGETDIGPVSEEWAYATEMYFNKGQMLWDNGNESYNAVLSAVNTETEYHITHWMPMPEPPKEVDNGT